MSPTARIATVELVDGYTLTVDGRESARVEQAEITIEGGFVHVRVPGADVVQVVSAPGVRKLTY
ncbi:hypothetical protein [Saccharothrix variisporea]|uniref:Uncharacterized protein n=1 Tax=Saccharothrix variisporea TaxID=543527 RepID=A0A495X3R1_9PSEU|nr:hypothetical protein [Saccharothrix variisporea]RKT68590.1 hypothetical protein DFJ66_1782 [Saccharothrix variisporea]